MRVAITMADLYIIKGGHAWNFVFGQAMKSAGLGCFSFARYQPGGFRMMWRGGLGAGGEGKAASAAASAAKTATTPSPRKSLLYRSAKVLTHEIGHLFGIKHCTHYECLMSGCNHLQEFDGRPLHLCPVDLRKLHTATGFDVAKRYREMAKVYRGFGWEGEAAWCDDRVTFLTE